MSSYERDHDGLWFSLFKRCDMLLLRFLFYNVFYFQGFNLTPSSGCTHVLPFPPFQRAPQAQLALGIPYKAHCGGTAEGHHGCAVSAAGYFTGIDSHDSHSFKFLF